MPENSEKIYQDEQIGPVRLCKSARARRIIVRVHPIKGVSVTVPRWMPYAAGIVFFRSRRDWVLAVLERQRSQGVPRESLSEEEIEAMRAQAKRELPPRLAELAALHGFAYNRVFIKNNASNWGSCSAKGNINLNLRLVAVEPHLRDYVILHELCHLRHPNHGPGFHASWSRCAPATVPFGKNCSGIRCDSRAHTLLFQFFFVLL